MSSCRAANTTANHTANYNSTEVDLRGFAILNASYGGQYGCLMQYLWMAVACQSANGTIVQNRSGSAFNPDAVGYDEHFLCRPPNETWEGVQQIDNVWSEQAGKPTGETQDEYWKNYGGHILCKYPEPQEKKASATPRFRTLFTVSTVATLALMVVTVTL